MAKLEHLEILGQGVKAWNQWRRNHRDTRPDLSQAALNGSDLFAVDFSGVDLRSADLTNASLAKVNLSSMYPTGQNKVPDERQIEDFFGEAIRVVNADLRNAKLREAHLDDALMGYASLVEADLTRVSLRRAKMGFSDLSRACMHRATLCEADLSVATLTGANLSVTNLIGCNLHSANLSGANLSEACLSGAFLYGANLHGANLTKADLSAAVLVNTDLTDAILDGCHVYGCSAWDIDLEGAQQRNLLISRLGQPAITVDDLEIAQFIYLLLENKKVRNLVDAVTSKVVLILGRFTKKHKNILDAIRVELRQLDLAPILFDFEKPANKDVTGTVETLARMARFVVADLTDPSSIPHELATIVPFLRTTPVVPIRRAGAGGYSMFDDFKGAYPWVLDIYEYKNKTALVSELPQIITRATELIDRLRKRSKK